MNLVFDIETSAEFWRQRYPKNRAPQAPEPLEPRTFASTSRNASALVPDWIAEDFLAPTNGVLHVLTRSRQYSRSKKQYVFHSWDSPIPEGSFYKLESNVYIESPEFMFLHAASIVNLQQLIAFADELCGYYSFDARDERGFAKRTVPLTSKDKLGYFLQKAGGCRGTARARRALPFIVDASASPMETFDEMTMCLPYRWGGYGLFEPAMNHPVPLSDKAARIAQRNTCYLDIGYPEHHLDIEHHGKLDHSSDEDKESDFARVLGLKEMDYEVIELTKNQVNDLLAYEFIIERIAQHIGKYIRKDALGATPQRLALRKTLFDWNRSSGRLR